MGYVIYGTLALFIGFVIVQGYLNLKWAYRKVDDE